MRKSCTLGTPVSTKLASTHLWQPQMMYAMRWLGWWRGEGWKGESSLQPFECTSSSLSEEQKKPRVFWIDVIPTVNLQGAPSCLKKTPDQTEELVNQNKGAHRTTQKERSSWSWNLDRVGSRWRVHVKSSPVLVTKNDGDCQQGNDRVCYCFQKRQMRMTSRSHVTAATCTLMHLDTHIHPHTRTHIVASKRTTPVTAPIRNGYFFIK